jgi:hypothetical protein
VTRPCASPSHERERQTSRVLSGLFFIARDLDLIQQQEPVSMGLLTDRNVEILHHEDEPVVPQ